MADYDFRSLSSHDCALLVRDLLEAKLNLPLESFSSGPGSGIDFRYQHESTNLILQSKLYATRATHPGQFLASERATENRRPCSNPLHPRDICFAHSQQKRRAYRVSARIEKPSAARSTASA